MYYNCAFVRVNACNISTCYVNNAFSNNHEACKVEVSYFGLVSGTATVCVPEWSRKRNDSERQVKWIDSGPKCEGVTFRVRSISNECPVYRVPNFIEQKVCITGTTRNISGTR